MTGGLLRCENIHVAYGAFKALSGITHEFRPGHVYGLIGPNGAGKTTLMNALSGHVPVAQGRALANALALSTVALVLAPTPPSPPMVFWMAPLT